MKADGGSGLEATEESLPKNAERKVCSVQGADKEGFARGKHSLFLLS